MTEKRYLSWSAYENLLRAAIASLPRPISEFHFVTGVPRGGLIAAVYLSHQYGLKFLDLQEALNLAESRADLIVADDICDSGSTLYAIYSRFGLRELKRLTPMPVLLTALARNKFKPAQTLGDEVNKGYHPVTGEKTRQDAVPIDVWAGQYYGDTADIWWTFPYERADAAPERDGTHA